MDWKIIFIILICLFVGFVAGAVRERILVSEKLAIGFGAFLIKQIKEIKNLSEGQKQRLKDDFETYKNQRFP